MTKSPLLEPQAGEDQAGIAVLSPYETLLSWERGLRQRTLNPEARRVVGSSQVPIWILSVRDPEAQRGLQKPLTWWNQTDKTLYSTVLPEAGWPL